MLEGSETTVEVDEEELFTSPSDETDEEEELEDIPGDVEVSTLDEDGWYYSMEDVSEYLIVYGELPENYITKSEAEALGWQGGSVERYLEGAAIGGDRFYNNEGDLPKEKGRLYYECDIDTNGASGRGPERIVFSNDGLIYYTPDHYETFELLYGEE
ncbi:MAG: ribonuclease [Butyricicoccus sp.]|nr:ribonuclease [Butyricicoccus sp.]MBQ8585971.1 ribonuclease [Butyricicoccus sp.]